MLGEDLGGLAQRRQRAVVLEHPREDVLAREQLRALAVDVGQQAVGRPAGAAAVRVARLVDDRVERVASEGGRRDGVVQEGGRFGRELEQVVELLGAVAHPEHRPELAHAAGREAVAVGQPEVELVQVQHPLAVLRVALEVALVALERAPVGRRVDVVDVAPHGRQAAGDERLGQSLGRQRQVRRRAEAAEALPEHAPALDAERAADRARRRARSSRRGSGAGSRPARRASSPVSSADRRRATGAALVEHQHAVVLERASEPSRAAGGARRARRLVAGAALEEHQVRAVGAVHRGHLACEHRDGGAVGLVVVERDGELVLGEAHARELDRNRAALRASARR